MAHKAKLPELRGDCIRISDEEEPVSPLLSTAPSSPGSFRSRPLVTSPVRVVGLLGVAALASVLVLAPLQPRRVPEEVSSSAGEVMGASDASPVSLSFTGADLVVDPQASASAARAAGQAAANQAMSALGSWSTASPSSASSDVATWASVASTTGMKPLENKHDGNVCADDEEEFEKLCYKRCTDLTGGEFPIRTTPWSCCMKHPCGFQNQKHDPGFCSGFDVAGDQGRSCPHRAGACLNDEELFLGGCFKKCSILTNDEFVHRAGAASCCKKSGIQCFVFPWNTKTRSNYNVGGGKGDSDPSTPSKVHMPLKSLTEA